MGLPAWKELRATGREQDRHPAPRVRVRAAVAALALVIIVAALTPYLEIVVGGTQIGSFAPSGNAILPFLLVALLLNPFLRRVRPSLELNRAELIVVYVALLGAATVASCQFAQWVIPVTTGPFYYGTPFNSWPQLTHLIPTWWRPDDPDDIRRFYEGLAPGETVNWAVWWRPLMAWGPFVLALSLTLLCVSAILRRPWVDHERLPFPLVQMPLEVAAEGPAFLRSRLVLFGALLPIVVHGLNGLNHLEPIIPSIPTRDLLPGATIFSQPPWSALQPIRVDIYFCLIGFAFLSGRDVPFSLWFFFVLMKLAHVFGAAMGWTPGGEDRSLVGNTFPLVEAQHVGAVLALVAISLWTARRHLRAVVGKALGRRPDVDDRAEPLSYRLAVAGAALGFVAMVVWCVASGMPLWVAAGTMAVVLLFLIGLQRMMAEGGINFLWAAQSGPNYLVHSLGGGALLAPQTWLVLLTLPYFTWHFKGVVGPQALEGYRLAGEARAPMRRVTYLAAGGIVLSMVVAYWSVVYLVHTSGGGVALDGYRFVHVGQRPFTELQAVTGQRSEFSLPKALTMVAAAAFTLLLSHLRWQFVWWRLHPLGYAASTMWGMNFMWFSLLLGSTASAIATRFGGLSGYRNARPLFLGMVMGEFLMVGFWLVVHGLLGVRGFVIFGH